MGHSGLSPPMHISACPEASAQQELLPLERSRCCRQVLVENRLSRRMPHVDMLKTRFYAETANKDMADWDEGAILEAKEELCRELRDPDRSIIGGAVGLRYMLCWQLRMRWLAFVG